MRKILYGILGCLLLIAMFLGIQRLTDTQILTWDESVTAKQFSENIYSIKETDFRVYDGALYTPEDFAAYGTELSSGAAPAEYQDAQTGKNISKYYRSDFARFKTDYLELHLEPGKTYGIHVENATYAMRLWADGRLLAKMEPSATWQRILFPLTQSNTVYFTASGDVTTIVMQRANFNHTYWNTAVIKLGASDLIEAMAQKQLLGVCLTIITLLVTALINLGMFFYSPKRGNFLFFALACAFIAIRTSLTDPKPIMLLFPNLNWYFGHRLEHIAFILTGLFLILFYYGIFRKFLPKILPVITIILTGGVAMGYIVLPSLLYSRYSRRISYHRRSDGFWYSFSGTVMWFCETGKTSPHFSGRAGPVKLSTSYRLARSASLMAAWRALIYPVWASCVLLFSRRLLSPWIISRRRKLTRLPMSGSGNWSR